MLSATQSQALRCDATANASALEVRAVALETLLERSGGENLSEVQWLRGRLAETREELERETAQT